MAVSAARRPRSGSHLVKRGEIYHYRRAVPQDVRAAFDGKSEVTRSLDTSNEAEARRLEKKLDVEFEERLHRARDAANPNTRRARIAKDILEAVPRNKAAAQWGVAYLPAEDREAVRSLVMPHYEAQDAHRAKIDRLVYEIEQALPRTPLDPETWEKCRSGILSVVRHHIANLTTTPARLPVTAAEEDLPTIEWAYGRWLRKRAGRRKDDSVDRARSHLNEFVAETGLVMLADARRPHLLRWRDKLVDAGALAKGSINLRLQFVGAILRAGWRDAEIPEQNLRDIILLTDDQKQRVTWSRTEILTALNGLEPGSWSAWLYLIGLTTATRLGEPTAARVGWFNPRTSMIEVDDGRYTKAHKKHVMPIIECLREPLNRLAEGRDRDDYLFDAPRPANPRIPISHETSKWFGRFFDKACIDRVYHELRHTWIEEARHSPVEREIWEIISGHSAATVSDRYGGRKPDVLAAANEKVCEFLTSDPELKAAMLRLVS